MEAFKVVAVLQRLNSASQAVYVIRSSNVECILKSAEQFRIDVDDSCRACGACSSCVGNLVSGTVDQLNQNVLDDDQARTGYSPLCVAYATSDLVIQTDCEEGL